MRTTVFHDFNDGIKPGHLDFSDGPVAPGDVIYVGDPEIRCLAKVLRVEGRLVHWAPAINHLEDWDEGAGAWTPLYSLVYVSWAPPQFPDV